VRITVDSGPSHARSRDIGVCLGLRAVPDLDAFLRAFLIDQEEDT
jgi:hypothetical protein